MDASATSNRREERMRQTAAALTNACRRLTADRGLAGFTVDEVCAEVDISRRTFFNYFPSKDDAVLGVDSDEEFEALTRAFLEKGASGWGGVVDDLVDLVVAHFENATIDLATHLEFMSALEREPRLLARFMGITRERDRQVAAFVAQREGVEPTDARALAAVALLSTLLRQASEHLFDPADSREFADIITDLLAAFCAVTPNTAPRKAAS
ncbi:TetR family transcriptional regulator [Marisediminicola sp. LYQ134]|uniref:TetR family transcriptional regulator n=1 Tax=Marisediminicola sp. LYQ134 TaxID=3391061 RepID=UPI0039837B11